MIRPPGQAADRRPLIAHVVFSFDYGGLENGVANLINGLPDNAYRHTIVALTSATGFRSRILRPDVSIHALNKQPGKDPGAYLRLFRLLKDLGPAIVHTRNLGTIDAALIGRLAGATCRIHGEHGWDIFDPDGSNRKYRHLRRFMGRSIDRFVTVSRELERWLIGTIGINPDKVLRICNGVDTKKFRPRARGDRRVLPADRFPADCIVVGAVTRFGAIKDPLGVVDAFIAARNDPAGSRLRLVMVGAGELHAEARRRLQDAGTAGDTWLPGSRDDVADLLREMDVFVLGSRREGISNTILEAMSTGLPVIATATGGNPELVADGITGRLVAPGSPAELTEALLQYARESGLRRAHGEAGRRRVVEEYSIARMLADYDALYRTRFGSGCLVA